MIESTVYTGKNFITGIFNNIYCCNKITGFTYNKFSRLKPNLEMTVYFFSYCQTPLLLFYQVIEYPFLLHRL